MHIADWGAAQSLHDYSFRAQNGNVVIQRKSAVSELSALVGRDFHLIRNVVVIGLTRTPLDSELKNQLTVVAKFD